MHEAVAKRPRQQVINISFYFFTGVPYATEEMEGSLRTELHTRAILLESQYLKRNCFAGLSVSSPLGILKKIVVQGALTLPTLRHYFTRGYNAPSINEKKFFLSSRRCSRQYHFNPRAMKAAFIIR